MPEHVCPKCVQRMRGERCSACAMDNAIAKPDHAAHVKTAPPPSDGAIRAGDPPIHPSETQTPDTPDILAEKQQPTFAGCFLTLICVAVTFGLAVPIVMWRDADTGQPLPRMGAIAAPILAG